MIFVVQFGCGGPDESVAYDEGGIAKFTMTMRLRSSHIHSPTVEDDSWLADGVLVRTGKRAKAEYIAGRVEKGDGTVPEFLGSCVPEILSS